MHNIFYVCLFVIFHYLVFQTAGNILNIVRFASKSQAFFETYLVKNILKIKTDFGHIVILMAKAAAKII